jgi:hypothetical protein
MRRAAPSDLLSTKTSCVTFYNKGLGIFKENVRDKLRSLVDNLDYSQL